VSLLAKLRMYRRVFARAKSTPGFVRLLRRRRALMLAVGAYESALFLSGSVDTRIKTLAQLKTSSLVGCPF
jgi:hypothetical protein